MRTIADYRQLNDALFHAGLGSGSEFEYRDEANGLHFYVVDLARDRRGVRSYTVAVRSSHGSGPHARGVSLEGPVEPPRRTTPHTPFTVTLSNAGAPPATPPDAHPDDVEPHLGFDVFRLSASVDGRGWSARLPNALAAVRAGASQEVTIFVSPAEDADPTARVTVEATSESDPSRSAVAEWTVRR